MASFSPRHIPALVIATSTSLGGLWPMLSPRAAMLEFGFPRKIAETPAAAPVMVIGQARNTVLGLLTFLFYYQGKYAEIDNLMVILAGYVGVVDCIQLWKVGEPKRGLFRLVISWVFVASGVVGLTASTLPGQ